MPSENDIRQHVIRRIEYFSGAKSAVSLECYLDRDVGMDPEDLIDLCEDLELTYSIDLRPFFEDGVSMRRWWIFWKHPVARDVSVKELSDHIAQLLSSD